MYCSFSFSRTSGSARIWTSSSCRRLTIASGVFAGTTKPIQASAWMSLRPLSASVGSSGNAPERLPVATASALTLPALTCGITAAAGSTATSALPERSAVTAGPDPAYGTWTTLVPLFVASASIARCEIVPAPIDA